VRVPSESPVAENRAPTRDVQGPQWAALRECPPADARAPQHCDSHERPKPRLNTMSSPERRLQSRLSRESPFPIYVTLAGSTTKRHMSRSLESHGEISCASTSR
jgi:hypothetical protein